MLEEDLKLRPTLAIQARLQLRKIGFFHYKTTKVSRIHINDMLQI